MAQVQIPAHDATCRLSLLLALSLAPRGFSLGTPPPPQFSPLLKNQHFQTDTFKREVNKLQQFTIIYTNERLALKTWVANSL